MLSESPAFDGDGQPVLVGGGISMAQENPFLPTLRAVANGPSSWGERLVPHTDRHFHPRVHPAPTSRYCAIHTPRPCWSSLDLQRCVRQPGSPERETLAEITARLSGHGEERPVGAQAPRTTPQQAARSPRCFFCQGRSTIRRSGVQTPQVRRSRWQLPLGRSTP